MDLSEIVAVTGLPGLFKVAGKKSDGVIITSLVDGKSQFVGSRHNQATTLDSIVIYTTGDNASLKDVLASIKKNQAKHPVPDLKDEGGVKKWLGVVLPDYDKEKVHFSDMKKLVKWYNILNEKNLIEELTAEKKQDDGEEVAVEKKEAVTKTENKTKSKKTQVSGKAQSKPAPIKKITTPRKAT
ncbi:MAG: DUF5606 domain-containing protein [Bacteroidetes bacterium]|nr:DUF5606 domain-containing protein [Bacteroidota bacterium]